MDIRLCTQLIVRKDSEYLVGTILYSTEVRWSISPWDAWMTRDKKSAAEIARATGGRLMLFNPVAGQLKEM